MDHVARLDAAEQVTAPSSTMRLPRVRLSGCALAYSTCSRPVTCNPGSMPYPKSKDLVGWEFKSGCNPGYGSGSVKGASADTFFPSSALVDVASFFFKKIEFCRVLRGPLAKSS